MEIHGMSIEVFFNRPARSLPIDRLCAEISGATETLGVACAWFTLSTVADAIIASPAKTKIVVFSSADLGRAQGAGKKTYQRIETAFRATGRMDDSVHLLALGSDDWQEGIMHNKFVVVDRSIVWTGSYNLTYQASKNYETLLRIDDKAVAETFWQEIKELAFQENALWLGGTQFARTAGDEGAFRCFICEKLKPISQAHALDVGESFIRCKLCALTGKG